MTVLTKKKILSYTLLPELKPRMRDLFLSGLHYIPYFMALVYQAVRLLPSTHPYLNPENMGRYGVRHVVAEAANNLVVSRQNIDQLLLFIMILFGLVIVFAQIILLGFSIIAGPAMAAMPTTFSGFFLTPDETAPQDLAYILLDMVFGIPEMFGSCVDTTVAETCQDIDGVAVVGSDGQWILQSLGWPFPVHVALHQMLQMYSVGLLVVATLITLYFIATIVAETAQTGTAFGKRFNKVWAPIRIVVAFGLLIPVGHGLNSSQYIVLYAAKFGSGFATNGWNIFNENLGTASFAANEQKLISQPNVPEVGGLLQFLYAVRICFELEVMHTYKGDDDAAEIHGWLVGDPFLPPPNPRNIKTTSYEDMIDFANGDSQVVIRFGVHDPDSYPKEKGNVYPTCGELIMPLTDPRPPGEAEPGPEALQKYYWFVIWEIITDVFSGISPHPELDPYVNSAYPKNTVHKYTQWEHDPNALLPPPEYKSALQRFYSQDLVSVLLNPAASDLQSVVGDTGALELQEEDSRWTVDQTLREKGWAGAGLWYNKIAQLNGSMTTSTLNIPMPSLYPAVMEEVMEIKKQQDQQVSIDQRFLPKLASGDDVKLSNPAHIQFAGALWRGFEYWQLDGHVASSHTAATGNPAYDMINGLLGTEGLFSMRKNEDVHPLAQLVGVGRSLVESAIRNLGYATAATVAGAMGKTFGNFPGDPGMLIGVFMTLTQIGLTAGFILFYIVPFMPFIYFFFAVGGWVKGIFEAMVGAPLWALAHIRIDGNGLPGQAAVNGYFLIFEIFIRPILIVFGLLASVSIFAALVSVLNETWDLVTANLTGFDAVLEEEGTGESLSEFMRNPIDEFFFTVVYTIVVYMMGMSSFKLIDLIPNNILRWMGQSVTTFNDESENPAEGLAGKAAVGGQQISSNVGGGLQSLLQGIGK